MKLVILSLLLSCTLLVEPILADNADVLDVTIDPVNENRYTFTVTVNHKDSGWDHYVDRWEILTPDNQIVAVRVLRHPHIENQPFSRPLRYIEIPDGISKVKIRAHCSRDGYVGMALEKQLPGRN